MYGCALVCVLRSDPRGNLKVQHMTATETLEAGRPSVGEIAPRFSLPSLSGSMVDLAWYRGRSNVIVWFSRGFTCPFCRVYTDGVRAGYDALRAFDTEVIQVAPNLLESARRYFGESVLPFPFVCDPEWPGRPEGARGDADGGRELRPRVHARRRRQPDPGRLV